MVPSGASPPTTFRQILIWCVVPIWVFSTLTGLHDEQSALNALLFGAACTVCSGISCWLCYRAGGGFSICFVHTLWWAMYEARVGPSLASLPVGCLIMFPTAILVGWGVGERRRGSGRGSKEHEGPRTHA